MSGAFGGKPGWGDQPHEETSTQEHFKDVEETVRRDREAEKVVKAHAKRPWWRFWGNRTG